MNNVCNQRYEMGTRVSEDLVGDGVGLSERR